MGDRGQFHPCEDDGDNGAPNRGQPGEQSSEVVAGGGEDGVGGVAEGALEEVAAHAVLSLGVADDGLNGRAAAEFALDGVGDAPPRAGDVDLEPRVGRSVVAAIAAVGDDA